MQIRITATDGVPIYVQIVNQVKHLASSGRLGAGEELPPIRVLAERLLINPNTVARAYLELERAGVVTKRQGSGTYISEASSPLSRRERLKVLTQRVDSLVVEAAHLDVDLENVLELVRERHGLIHSGAIK
ncbi:MAG TPA: GntR family transcriptional regulator [Verrucomicrobiae bacterium]|nr:GntR family transcriptional regulator [Verrucomicrobiae bacterium]